MTDNTWMQDPTLKGIPAGKLDFLQKLVFEMNTLSDKEKLPFLLALANRAKKEQITFQNDEVNAIITVLKKHSTPDEIARMDKMLQSFVKHKQ